jgi:two-component system sensor histidine kinase BaeS
VSFRLRVLTLIGLVALTATAATAWLIQWQLSRQVAASAAADRQTIASITEELTAYGRTHGTWEGVVEPVLRLSQRTGQRIQLVTDAGEVVVDTDTLQGRTARRSASPAIAIDPRPVLQLPDDRAQARAITMAKMDVYRSEMRYAACLTRHGIGVVVNGTDYGVPRLGADPKMAAAVPQMVDACLKAAAHDANERAVDADRVAVCEALPVRPRATASTPAQPPGAQAGTAPQAAPAQITAPQITATQNAATQNAAAPTVSPSLPPDVRRYGSCLQDVFNRRIGEAAPVPLQVYLGAVADGPKPFAVGPIVAAAGLVAVLAIVGTALLSRRVLRPIAALTSASQRLGEGDLSERVPVVGRDELAEVARSFNRMADSLQRGEERQRRMVADVAHELRTPLANLRGYLEALKDGVMEPDPALFASLHEEAVLQQRIVDDLQDLALAEAGRLVYRRTRIDVRELLETCRTGHHAVADAAGVRLVVSPAQAEPLYIHADPDRLRQVLGNLVTNAVRATAPGGMTTLAANGTFAAGVPATVTITVTDTGTGIPPTDLPHIFDRFWRADAARGRATGGSGLGLAIAKLIVTDHGGTIRVASRVGVGTTFRMTLPAAGDRGVR